MQGVSEVIAIILILMITISLAGLAYMFMSTTMSDVTSSAGSTVDTTTSSMLTSFRIESADANYVYVRNTGQNTLVNLAVYVNDIQTNSVQDPIAAGNVSSIALGQVAMKGDAVKVTSSDGFSTQKVLTADCYGSIGYWKLDESDGLYAYDSSPNGNTGNLTNGPVWTTGKFGGAISLNGTNYINTGNNSVFQITGDLTISFWLYPKNVGGERQGIISKNYGHEFELVQETDGRITFYHGSSSTTSGSFPAGTSVNNVWTFVTFVRNTNENKTYSYVNGALAYNTSYTPVPVSSTNTLYIGRRFAVIGSQYFNGTIDDVTIWNRALAPQEVLKLYSKNA